MLYAGWGISQLMRHCMTTGEVVATVSAQAASQQTGNKKPTPEGRFFELTSTLAYEPETGAAGAAAGSVVAAGAAAGATTAGATSAGFASSFLAHAPSVKAANTETRTAYFIVNSLYR
jgi:hypothetical protein